MKITIAGAYNHRVNHATRSLPVVEVIRSVRLITTMEVSLCTVPLRLEALMWQTGLSEHELSRMRLLGMFVLGVVIEAGVRVG